jgi:hypothetical protein
MKFEGGILMLAVCLQVANADVNDTNPYGDRKCGFCRFAAQFSPEKIRLAVN